MRFGGTLVAKAVETIVVIIVGGMVILWAFGTPELEYKSGYKDKYFNILAKVPKELTLEYRGENIENISVFEFAIFNRTLKDISGVRLYFKITPKGEGKVPEIISRGVYPPTPLPEIGITEKETGTANLYAFDIDTLKRTGSNSFYLARFIFKGDPAGELLNRKQIASSPFQKLRHASWRVVSPSTNTLCARS